MNAPDPVVVTYEDRPAAYLGVELLARSLARHSPGLRLLLYGPDPALAARLADLPQVSWQQTQDLTGQGWNVKPAILLRALEQHPRALWLDTDIVVTGDLSPLLARFGPEDLVVGQEFHVPGTFGGRLRARAYGLEPGRDLPHHVNSGSIMATRRHRELLTAWSALLASPEYQAAQRQRTEARPPAFVGDQDALWALLASTGFADLPVGYLETGTDMIQHCGANGYALRDRVTSLRGARPAFVHMLGRYKPWSFDPLPSPLSRPGEYVHAVSYELSPFLAAARPYAAALGNPPWLRRRTLAARLMHALALGNVALAGMPLALVAALSRRSG